MVFLHVATVFFAALFVHADQNKTILANQEQRNYCLDRANAQQIAQNYGLLLTAFSNELADAAVSPDYTQYSTSTNTLINNGCGGPGGKVIIPPLSPTFTNRDAFKAAQGSQPAAQFSQLDLWHACDSVTIRYEMPSVGGVSIPNPRPVVGMVNLRTTPAPVGNQYPYYIQTVYSEFDLVAYIANLKASGGCKNAR